MIYKSLLSLTFPFAYIGGIAVNPSSMVNCSSGGGGLSGNNGTGRLSLPLPLTACHRCDVCGKLLSTKLTLKRHKEQQHLQPLNNAVCNLCHKVFRTLNSLNNHKSIYHRRQKGHHHHHHGQPHHPSIAHNISSSSHNTITSTSVQSHQDITQQRANIVGKPCIDFL